MNVALLTAAIPGATLEEGFGPVTVDVPSESWSAAATVARDDLGCGFFDFLTSVHEPEGLRVVCHLVSLDPFGHLLLRTLLGPDNALESLEEVYAGATWHERETAEMFGVRFVGGDGDVLARDGLLLPPGFVGHPLRKDFPLASREEKAWPGTKEVGE